MSVCVPILPSSSLLSLASSLSTPCTPSHVLSAPTSPLWTSTEESFAEKLSKALESVLPMHGTVPRKHQRRYSLPTLYSSPVCDPVHPRMADKLPLNTCGWVWLSYWKELVWCLGGSKFFKIHVFLIFPLLHCIDYIHTL